MNCACRQEQAGVRRAGSTQAMRDTKDIGESGYFVCAQRTCVVRVQICAAEIELDIWPKETSLGQYLYDSCIKINVLVSLQYGTYI